MIFQYGYANNLRLSVIINYSQSVTYTKIVILFYFFDFLKKYSVKQFWGGNGGKKLPEAYFVQQQH